MQQITKRAIQGAAPWLFSVGAVAVLSVGAVAAEDETAVEAPPGAMTDAEIETALETGCRRNHPIEHYRGLGNRHDVLGPLWLEEPGEDRPRGVILPPFLRVYLAGRSRKCNNLDIDAARELAGPEIWVVLWRFEDPPSPPFRRHTTSDQKVLRPTEVRQRADGAWHKSLWTRSKDNWVSGWFGADWDDGEGLVAAFSDLSRIGALHVDYKVEEKGRSYLTESEIFSISTFREKWWAAAFGEEQE